MMNLRNLLLLLISVILIYACEKDDPGPKKLASVAIDSVQLNPYGFAPLTAGLLLTVSEGEVTAEITVSGQNDEEDLKGNVVLNPQPDVQVIPIMGLYPAYDNQVKIVIIDANNNVLDSTIYGIQTDSMPYSYGSIDVEGNLDGDAMIFAVNNAFQRQQGEDLTITQSGVLFDMYGKIRWYSDFTRQHSILEIIDGKIYAGSSRGEYKGKIVVYDFMGKELEVYDYSKNGTYENVHHDIRKTASGSLLITVNKVGAPTAENFVLEYDPSLLGNNVQTELDLESILPSVDDLYTDLPGSYYAEQEDILHINGVYPLENDEMLLSSQRAGIAQVNYVAGTLSWYLFPHVVQAKPQGTPPEEDAGVPSYLENIMSTYGADSTNNRRPPANGIFPTQDYSDFEFNYAEFLLHPLDASGDPINDTNVVIYGHAHTDFEFPSRPHAPILLENGNIVLFDNGAHRAFDQGTDYSRAVEYEINEDGDGIGGTVKQVWEYALPDMALAAIVGDVRELSNGNRLVCFGSIGWRSPDPMTIVIVEVTPTMPANEVFKLTLVDSPNTIYRANKIRLY